jgi:hypothetical protein
VAPQQAIPTKALMCETFRFRFGDVTEDTVDVVSKRLYFRRPRKCYEAWRNGTLKHMGFTVGLHPMEDVMHIHSWVQVHILLAGKAPTEFYPLPRQVERPPEFVPGRIYPVYGPEIGGGRDMGVLCVCPNGLNCWALKMLGDDETMCFELTHLSHVIYEFALTAAPLVFRPNAVLDCDDYGLGVIQDRAEVVIPITQKGLTQIMQVESRQYLGWDGKYHVHTLDSEDLRGMEFTSAHTRLLPLGTHMVVPLHKMPPDTKIPSNFTHVKGWLRYADEYDEADPCKIYVAFRVGKSENDMQDVDVIPFSPVSCEEFDKCIVSPDKIANFIFDE